MKFILASKSPRRREILKTINLDFKIIPSTIDESQILIDKNPKKYCLQLAKLKSKDISNRYHNYTVIGADTIVVIRDQILNKPKSLQDAKRMLSLLSDKTHQVITAVSIRNKELNIKEDFIETTSVTFYKLTDDEILKYIDTYRPFDKAGSYGIQDGSNKFVKKITGSYHNIVGFPIAKFYQILKNKYNLFL